MTKSPDTLLAESLKRVQAKAHLGVIRSSEISRTDRERLLRGGWLRNVIKGWYLLTGRPLAQADEAGDTTLWYSHFWDFVGVYLSGRYDNEYCLSAEASLDLHTGSSTIPAQVVALVKRGGGQPLYLPHDTSLLPYPDPNNLPTQFETKAGVSIMTLPEALCRISPRYFIASPLNAQLALRQVDESALSLLILERGYQRPAGRLAGAYRAIGEPERAERILKDMTSVGYRVLPTDPFEGVQPALGSGRVRSPYSARLEATWASMRDEVLATLPAPPGLPTDKAGYLARIDDLYQHDAYNSLSIEGYRVTPELIEKIENGEWDPDRDAGDRETRGALAAKGYLESFRLVKSILRDEMMFEWPPERRQGHLIRA
ncbi:hypothetical protein [Endothiovibrio diazotrophicus]